MPDTPTRPSAHWSDRRIFAVLHILFDLGVVLSVVFVGNVHWQAIGAGPLQSQMMYLSIALALVYGTAFVQLPRPGLLWLERIGTVGLVVLYGWGDGLSTALMRFAFAEIIALSLSLGACLVLYRFFFAEFSAETLEARGLPRLVAMGREYWTEGAVLPIIFFGFPLLGWSGFALYVYISAPAAEGALAIVVAGGVIALQIHARWVVIYQFLRRATAAQKATR